MALVVNHENLESAIQYEGYQGIALDGENLKYGHNIDKSLRYVYDNPRYACLLKSMNALDKVTMSKVKKSAKTFCKNHFDLHHVLTTDTKTIKDNYPEISKCSSSKEMYDTVNSLLKEVDPFDLPVKVLDKHSMFSVTRKPILRINGHLDDDNRKMYFEEINIGKMLNMLSAGVLVHEIAHVEQESNLGYAEDYLNKEFISFFLEKVAIKELDQTGDLLRLAEMVRYSEFVNKYGRIRNCHNRGKIPDVNDLMYSKSLLLAIKLFDDYCNERDLSKRDEYFEEIQKVFDGKQTVEDIIRRRNIKLNTCVTPSVLGRHM